MTIAAPLRKGPFRLLFSGQVVSDLGDWLDYLALVVLIVYRWHYGTGALALLAVCLAAPWAVLGPVAGVWVDRLPRKPVLIAADVLRAGIVCGFVFAPGLGVLLALVAAKMSVSTFFVPAQQASIQATVPPEDLLAATSLSQLSLQATKILGPALGGVLVAAAGVHVAFALDAASFAVSAAILSFLPALPSTAAAAAAGAAGERSFVRELREGFAAIAGRRVLTLSIGSMAATVFLVFMFDSLSPLALHSLGVRAGLLGVAVGTIGGGAAVGTIVIGSMAQQLNPFSLMATGKLLVGGGVAGLGIGLLHHAHVATPVWLAALAAIGVGAAAILVPYSFVLQTRTPPEVMGRVVVGADAVQTLLAVGAPLAGAAIATRYGLGPLFTVAGAGLVVLSAVVWSVRQVGVVDEAAVTEGAGLEVVAHALALEPEGPMVVPAGLARDLRHAQPIL
jgi:MFS family permease